MFWGAVGALLILATTTTAWGQKEPPSAVRMSEWMDSCAAKDDARRQTFCRLYIRGFSDALIYWAGKLGRGTAPACIPGETTDDQLVKIAMDYVHKRPQLLRDEAPRVILNSLAGAFPSRKSVPP
jgi:hypothetical protein